MSLLIEYYLRFLNLIAPKTCVICGNRLTITERTLCCICNLHLPRTNFQKNPYDNNMAKLFWARIPVERVAAFFYYEPHSEVCRIVHSFKYMNNPENAEYMGRMVAAEYQLSNFFDSIDGIVPIPLSRKRQLKRGYNQSYEIARGVSDITGIPIINKVVKRRTFKKSQTKTHFWERFENVEDVFQLINGDAINGKHILLIDDVITTGATVISCAKEMKKCGDIKFSILSIGFTR